MELEQNEEFMKYIKRYKIKIPLAALKQQMKAEGKFEPRYLDVILFFNSLALCRRKRHQGDSRLQLTSRILNINLSLNSSVSLLQVLKLVTCARLRTSSPFIPVLVLFWGTSLKALLPRWCVLIKAWLCPRFCYFSITPSLVLSLVVFF